MGLRRRPGRDRRSKRMRAVCFLSLRRRTGVRNVLVGLCLISKKRTKLSKAVRVMGVSEAESRRAELRLLREHRLDSGDGEEDSIHLKEAKVKPSGKLSEKTKTNDPKVLRAHEKHNGARRVKRCESRISPCFPKHHAERDIPRNTPGCFVKQRKR